MKYTSISNLFRRPRVLPLGAATLLTFILVAAFATVAIAGTFLSVKGYLDFSYGSEVEPTDGRSEHKLWWNDGIWWGSLFNPQQQEYRIYRLNWGTQTWQDTGVELDDRVQSRADTLWDEASKKLYVLSHIKQENPSNVTGVDNWARLYRYSYNSSGKTYTLDADFPKPVNQAKTRTASLEKDSTGRLWVAYVSREIGSSTYQVYINFSQGDDYTWGAPVRIATIPVEGGPIGDRAVVATQDIAALVAFKDNGVSKIGLMWSNERAGVEQFFFASHPDSSAPTADWKLETLPGSYTANDHINLTTTSSGQIIGIVKTSATGDEQPLNVLLTRDTNGTWSHHTVNPVISADTKPIVVVYEPSSGPAKIYMFMSSNVAGGVICMMEAQITTPLSSISFVPRNCGAPGLDAAPIVIGDQIYSRINNATTTRQVLNENTDIVLLAGDQVNGGVYVHTVINNPPPGVIVRSPLPNATAATNTLVRATFNKDMNAATITSDSFKVTGPGSTAVSGTVAYNPGNRTVTFTPASPLTEGVEYTVTLSAAIKDTTGQTLMDAPVTWKFTAGTPSAGSPTLFLPMVIR